MVKTGVGQQVVHLARVVVPGQGPDNPLPDPGGQTSQHGSKRRAQEDEHWRNHPEDEVLRLVEGQKVVGNRVKRRLEGEED